MDTIITASRFGDQSFDGNWLDNNGLPYFPAPIAIEVIDNPLRPGITAAWLNAGLGRFRVTMPASVMSDGPHTSYFRLRAIFPDTVLDSTFRFELHVE